MLIGPERIRDLLPHAGAMCLLDAVVEYDAMRILCVATSHRAASNPLAREGRLAAVCGVEYAGQTMALHGALTMPARNRRAGYLAAVRDMRCPRAWLHDCGPEMWIEACLLVAAGSRVMYEFKLTSGGTVLGTGRAAVALEASPETAPAQRSG
ncbi:MAG TPA: hydroxymyristoyl-ACP dehydratase [Burkholderiales bacterium]|jgi:predicted hotdog family 3-hydroxylacyl-ACP dehydratase|nr:hydroxymyristoyl-ACP dehydratase [Burkholderiales bacterium]